MKPDRSAAASYYFTFVRFLGGFYYGALNQKAVRA